MLYLSYKSDNTINGLWDDTFHISKEIPTNTIKISKELNLKIKECGSDLKVKELSSLDVNRVYGAEDFDTLFIPIFKKCELPINKQDKFNADLLKQNAQLLTEINAQKQLNSQILLELAKLKGGNANV